MKLVTLEDIEAAAERISGSVGRTELLLQDWTEQDMLFLKPESLQPTGSFKVRGAYNAIALLDETQRARGVIAYSSGNHAQAVAWAARRFRAPAVIVVPDVAPRIKVDATRALGAEVIEVPLGEQEDVARRLAAERNLTLIPPYDHPAVIAGQGTIGLEIGQDQPGVDIVLVPVSGGGLASGIGTALNADGNGVLVYGVEPELAGDTAEGLRAGVQADWPVELRGRTIADGLRAQPSELTYAHLEKVLTGVFTVTEDEIREAVRVLAHKSKLVVEPSGAVAMAAYLFRRDQLPAEQRIVCVVSGGNADPAMYAEILGS